VGGESPGSGGGGFSGGFAAGSVRVTVTERDTLTRRESVTVTVITLAPGLNKTAGMSQSSLPDAMPAGPRLLLQVTLSGGSPPEAVPDRAMVGASVVSASSGSSILKVSGSAGGSSSPRAAYSVRMAAISPSASPVTR